MKKKVKGNSEKVRISPIYNPQEFLSSNGQVAFDMMAFNMVAESP
jgi:hypothetical protein